MADLLSLCANDLELNEVYEGDCLELLGDVEARSVHLAFADPPFNIGYDYDVYDDRRSAEEYLDWCQRWMQEVHRVLADDGTFWLAIGDEFAAELKVLAQRELGFHCRSWVIWYYTFGVNCKRGFSRSHTHLFHFVKDSSQFKFNGDNPAVRVPSARQLVYADARANPKGRLPDNTWILRPQDAPEGGFSTDHDTWYYPRVAGTFKEREGFHGCQMPEQILGRIIRLCSDPGDVVLDPFAGSGTTMAVAKKLGRQWLGTELSKEYVQHIRRRLKSAHPGDSLDGVSNPLESAPKTRQGKQRKSKSETPQSSSPAEQRIERLGPILNTHFDDVPPLALLLNPSLQAEFLKACRKADRDIQPADWNRALWSLTRKEQKFVQGAKSGQHQALFSVGSLDAFTPAAEAALCLVQRETGCTVQDVLCHPERAEEFDALAQRLAPDASPFELRWTAWVRLRQRSRRRRRKETAAGEGLTRRLPKAHALAQYEPARGLDVGVFVLEGAGKETLYVGSTAELSSHLQRFRELGWQHFHPTKVRWIREPHHPDRLQRELQDRLNPSLNLG